MVEVGFEIEDDYEDGMDDEMRKKIDDVCLNCEVDGCLKEMRYEKREFWIGNNFVERMVRVGGNCFKLWEDEMRGGFVSRINGFGKEDGLEVMDGIRGWGEMNVGKVLDDVWREILKEEKRKREEWKVIVSERKKEFERKWKSGEYLKEWRVKELRRLEKVIEEKEKKLKGVV